jgi:hypothetical protein
MMKIFGQPDNYSEILQRIWYTSIATGLGCTILLSTASPTLQNFINSITTTAEIGPIKNIKVLYVIIPLLIGILSRMLKLHDKISDVFRIRYLFDTRCLLYPLAKGAGITLTKDLHKNIGNKRVDSMYAVFYPYAGFKNPVIDEQLVRTAADNWGWFWVLLESFALVVVTTIALCIMKKWDYVFWCLIVLLVEFALMFMYWIACQNSGRRQVAAILADKGRRKIIAKYFQSL